LSSEQFDLDPEKVSSLIDTIKDWIDLDNEVTGFGAENEYYQGMEKPYSCKNAPLELLEELLLIKGVTRNLFYGTKEKPGISYYLTTHGDGKININTADPLVLRSLSDQMDQEMVEEMLAYREDKKNNLKDPEWYQKVSGMSQITIDPDLVTTSSALFEIKSEGFKEAMVKLVTGMVERSKDTLRILSWKIE
jgi:general secretion pathway protein K